MGLSRLRVFAAAAAVALLAGLGGCAATPEPEPTPTPLFASEEEAFAAAEEVYRAYLAAGDAKRSGDKEADPMAYLTGLALEDALSAQREYIKYEIVPTGVIRLEQFIGTSARMSSSEVEIAAEICSDVTDFRAMSLTGEDITPADRPNRFPSTVTFVRVHADLLLSDEDEGSGSACE